MKQHCSAAFCTFYIIRYIITSLENVHFQGLQAPPVAGFLGYNLPYSPLTGRVTTREMGLLLAVPGILQAVQPSEAKKKCLRFLSRPHLKKNPRLVLIFVRL